MEVAGSPTSTSPEKCHALRVCTGASSPTQLDLELTLNVSHCVGREMLTSQGLPAVTVISETGDSFSPSEWKRYCELEMLGCSSREDAVMESSPRSNDNETEGNPTERQQPSGAGEVSSGSSGSCQPRHGPKGPQYRICTVQL
eukprot:NODE_7666_length_751_cov_73.843949_g7417_i0.p1 GENE.NODE_7666_length_751_cov_73.843949_g7417_i0~~NODE_7666_length_751_cov_73.843949_g7417_i0.p1  ORF type:complete len:143 (-),score=13.53 NODE_7666_length_751_cov_73.843949_g7417_i0:90-518(-)